MKKNRRNLLKALTAGGGAATLSQLPKSWKKPVVDSVVLPSHAQTTGCSETGSSETGCSETGTVRVESRASDIDTARYVVLTDSSDTVLARCYHTGGDGGDVVIEVECLPSGTYHVFGSDSGTNHVMHVTTASGTTTVSANTGFGSCDKLVATISLPDGTVTDESGQTVGAGKCGPSFNCAEGGTG